MPPSIAGSPALPGALDPAWHEDGTPFSPEHGDVYYSRDDGLAESRHVFLEHNGLAERFRALPAAAHALFTIAETGFGTGLNFLLAWQLWRSCAPPGARLLFRSLEARPLSRAALARALEAWAELAELARALIDAWPPALAGLHVLEFDDGVSLQLFVGDVEEALEQFQAGTDGVCVDAWFLDGFAPARNPAMWSAQVLARVGALSRARATVATFSAAAPVRSGLERAGFRMRKVAGFGRKRDMLCGERNDDPIEHATPRRPQTPWHRALPHAACAREALVIGAGIAGCTSARALARRGWSVTVVEAGAAPAHAASGNPQAILFTQLPAADSAHGEFTLSCWLHATRYYAALLAAQPEARAACGMLQLYADSARESFERLRARYAALPELAYPVDREQASRIAGVPLAAGGMYLPASGWIDPRAACRAALDDARIGVRCGERIERLERTRDGWMAHSATGARLEAAVVVLANACAAVQLWPGGQFPLEPVRGQLTLLPETTLPAGPRCVVCAQGYVLPPREGTVCCGASFVRGERAGEPSEPEQRANLAQLAAILPGFDPRDAEPRTFGARVAERCATPDRLPLVGRVPDRADFCRNYAPLRHDARRVIDTRAAFEPGLMLNVGHGSRGMSSAPLAAELIAAELCAEPSPVTQRVARALSPARFVIRAIVRGAS